MKKIIKNNKKWIIVAALFLVTGLLFAVTFDFAAKADQYHTAKNSVEAVQKIKEEILHEAHIRRVISEDPAARIEKTKRVAVTASVEGRKSEIETPQDEPQEEIIPEEFYDGEDLYNEDDAQDEWQDEWQDDSDTDGEDGSDYEEDGVSAPEENGDYYSASDLRFLGEIYSGGFRWTWYSQNVLPGGGLVIPGRHVDENGYICDENDRICLASEDFPYGTVVSTPFGKEGCVYDCGCDYGTLDVYVDF